MPENTFDWTPYQPYLHRFPFDIISRCKLTRQDPDFKHDHVYFGPHLEEMKHGSYGITLKITPNNILIIYEGAWSKNTFEGQGSVFVISHPDNQKDFIRWAQGNWKQDKLHGFGIMQVYNKGFWRIIYRGQFADNFRNGKGYESTETNFYLGEFSKGSREGEGRLSDKNGNFYEGRFAQGLTSNQGFERQGNLFILTHKQKCSTLKSDKQEGSAQIFDFFLGSQE